MTDRNPQAEQMAHESMLRTLAAQAEAIWPQELPILHAYDLPDEPRMLDVGCGSGEAARRLAEAFPAAVILGVDVHEPHVARAREACAGFGDRVRFEVDDAFQLARPDDAFDLVLCRHMLQAVPTPERVLAELLRVTAPGGRIHLVAEDYAMLHFHPVSETTERFFALGPVAFARVTGTDLLSGRRMPALLRGLGLVDVRLDYAALDTERVARPILAAIFEAWRDGYAETLAEHTKLSADEVQTAFAEMIAACLDPQGFALWLVPIVSGRVP